MFMDCGAAARGPGLLRDRPDARRLAPDERHLSALPGELDRRGLTDPARGARDQDERHGEPRALLAELRERALGLPERLRPMPASTAGVFVNWISR